MDTISTIMVKRYLPQRISQSHKGTYGRVGVICGSKEMPGAARLVMRAAYKAGAGLVCAFAGQSFAPYLKNDIPEAIIKIVNETEQHTFRSDLVSENLAELATCNVLVAGCGTGLHDDVFQVISHLLLLENKNIVLDADALTLLQGKSHLLKKSLANVVITPHIKEMSRLTGESVEHIAEQTAQTARDFAVNNHVTVVLKSHQTVIASPDGRVFENHTGNSALSKGGTGDVLSGMIAGFAASKQDLLAASICAVYLHGMAAQIASKEMTEYAVSASDVIHYLPKALNTVLNTAE